MDRVIVKKKQETFVPTSSERSASTADPWVFAEDSLTRGADLAQTVREHTGAVIRAYAEGEGALGAVRTMAEDLLDNISTEKEGLSTEMEKLSTESAEEKKVLEERVQERNAQQAVAFSWKHSWFTGGYLKYVVGGLCFTLAFSVVFVAGRSLFNRYHGSMVPREPAQAGAPLLVEQLKETITSTKRTFSLREGFTTTQTSTESLKQHWSTMVPKD